MKRTLYVIFILFASLLFSSSCYEILTPSEIAGYYDGYGIHWGKSPEKFNITGRIVLGNPANGCSKFKNAEEIEGNIVLIDKDGCYPQEKMIHAHQAGATAAMLSAFDLQGQLNFVYDGRKHNSLNIPSIEVSISAYKDFKKQLKDDHNVTVVLYPTVLVWCFDPNTYFQIYPDWLSTNLGTAYAPFAVGAYLLLAFYWQELSSGVKGFNNVMPKLNKMKIPFIILFSIILALEVAGWVPRALNLDTEALTLMIVVIVAVTLISCTLFYFVQAYRILKVFRQSIKISNKSSNLKRVTTLIIVTGVCWLVSALVTAGLGLNLSSPRMIIAIYWVPYSLATIACTCMVLIFTPPSRSEGSSSELSMHQTSKTHTTDQTITTTPDSERKSEA